MSDHAIGLFTLLLQLLAVIGLAAYCVETYKIRKVSQKQIEVSQQLLQSSLDQIEGMSKPCVTFWAELRDGADVILETHSTVGNLVARSDAGSLVIQNIGNGVAVNIRYYITKGNPEFNAADVRRLRYIPWMQSTAKIALVEQSSLYRDEHEAIFDYESMGGRRYQTSVTLNNRVITSFRFQEISDRTL